jgi:hypothetical protein
MTRQYTEQLLEMIEDGILDRDAVIMAAVKYMSEDDVRDMMESNEFVPVEEDEEEDDDMEWDWNNPASPHHY